MASPSSPPDPVELWPQVQPEAARRLMRAGLESFARRGYHATTTRHIATGAGMSPAALYVHFSSKAALLTEISRSGHEWTLSLVRQAVARGTDPVERMRALVEEFVAWHAEQHVVARVAQYELAALPEEAHRVVKGLRRETEQVVRSTIRDGVEAGVFDVPDVRVAARAVLSLGIDVARWYSERGPRTPADLGQEYADLVLRMLGVRPAR
ncbi:TetR family transcriptional regulator [Wenjunlia vitaminophila]|uniref:TetR family transcriptional regulator n=1 Tax=Wenjunlia vitaminophila TaxID=76728 RepID=A0A0T6LWV9_WENVI|nr:TetR/AcrR family transcriptional regulator [Wenjunlia vitaminophila]KRV50322.1 TetR family transcriptional regulator [Wenjunlia vitaminophila]